MVAAVAAVAGRRGSEVRLRRAVRARELMVASVARMYEGRVASRADSLGRACTFGLATGRGTLDPAPCSFIPHGAPPLAKETRTGSRDFLCPEIVESGVMMVLAMVGGDDDGNGN